MLNGLVLLGLVFLLKYTEYGATLMGYGIISIAAYIIFLLWVEITSSNESTTTPFHPTGSTTVRLSAAMGQAFSIQAFFIPIMRKSRNKTNFMLYTILTYLIGGIIYYYIAYIGAYGNPRDIQEYSTDLSHVSIPLSVKPLRDTSKIVSGLFE